MAGVRGKPRWTFRRIIRTYHQDPEIPVARARLPYSSFQQQCKSYLVTVCSTSACPPQPRKELLFYDIFIVGRLDHMVWYRLLSRCRHRCRTKSTRSRSWTSYCTLRPNKSTRRLVRHNDGGIRSMSLVYGRYSSRTVDLRAWLGKGGVGQRPPQACYDRGVRQIFPGPPCWRSSIPHPKNVSR